MLLDSRKSDAFFRRPLHSPSHSPNRNTASIAVYLLHLVTHIDNLDLRHPRCACNIKVQCKEVKNITSLLSVIMLLIERHVSVYSETIIRFNKCQLQETNIFHGSERLDVEISTSTLVQQYPKKKLMRSVAAKYPGRNVPGAKIQITLWGHPPTRFLTRF